MKNNQPKFLTKAELRAAAMRELNVRRRPLHCQDDKGAEDEALDLFDPLKYQGHWWCCNRRSRQEGA